MAANRGFLLAVLVAAFAAAQLLGNAAAATYVVGDSLGWTVPPNGPAAYSTWASQHVFRPGDVLVFNFTTGIHDVAYVNRAGFDGCSSTTPISLITVGPASITLNSTGAHYYICTFGQHCSLGQRLAINVTAASTSPAPAPGPLPPTITPPPARPPTSRAPAPAPSGPITPTPTPTPAPSRSPSSSPSPGPSSGPSPAPGGSVTPSPGGSVTPPPSPGLASAPGAELTPPPPPSSATISTISAPFVVFVSIAFGLMF